MDGSSVDLIEVSAGQIVTVSSATTEITDEDGNTRVVPIVTFADDGQTDVITIEGRDDAADTFTISAVNPVDGSMSELRVIHAGVLDVFVSDTKRSELDMLIVDGLGGNDLIDASSVGDSDLEDNELFPDLVIVKLVGGTGNDTLIGSPFNDILDSGTGSDTVTGGLGLDTFFDASTALSGDVDTLVETQDLDMSLFEDYFITGRIVVPGGAFFSAAGMPTEAFLIAVMQGTNSDGINNDGDGFTDEADEADPNFRTVGDGDRYDAGATVENIKGIFEKAVLTGGDHNNTLVVNDSDNSVVINGQPLTVTPFDGSALLDNRGNEFDTNVENYIVSILPGNSTRVDIVDSGGASGVDRIVIFGTSQADSITLDGAGAGSFRMGIVRATGTSSTFVTFRGVERAEVYTLGGGDRVLSNDTGAVTVVDLGGSDDEMVIGTVPLVPDTGNRTLEFPDGVPVADTQNMTNGNSHPLFVLGDGQNDRMEVNHNRAMLYLHGGDGNDRFLLKTFLVLKENPDSPDEITNLSNLFGGSGANRYDYLENGPVFINGGSGTDTIVVVGTPIGDTFVVTDTYVAGAGRIVSFTAVEVVEVDGAGGADTIYVLATGNQFETVITGGSGDDTIHVGGDPPTLVFDPPAFTYTPPAFTVALPPELVFTDHSFNLNNFTMTVSLFDWIGAGGPLIPTSQASIQTAGAAMLARFVDHLKAILSQTYQYLQVDALDVGTFSARLRFDSFFSFLFDPRVYVSVDTLTLRYRIGSLEPRTKLVQPAPVTVDPLPFGFDAGRSLDVSKILNRLTIRGGDQFETAGDKVVVHNEEGTLRRRPPDRAHHPADGPGRRDPGPGRHAHPGLQAGRRPDDQGADLRHVPERRGHGHRHRQRERPRVGGRPALLRHRAGGHRAPRHPPLRRRLDRPPDRGRQRRLHDRRHAADHQAHALGRRRQRHVHRQRHRRRRHDRRRPRQRHRQRQDDRRRHQQRRRRLHRRERRARRAQRRARPPHGRRQEPHRRAGRPGPRRLVPGDLPDAAAGRHRRSGVRGQDLQQPDLLRPEVRPDPRQHAAASCGSTRSSSPPPARSPSSSCRSAACSSSGSRSATRPTSSSTSTSTAPRRRTPRRPACR